MLCHAQEGPGLAQGPVGWNVPVGIVRAYSTWGPFHSGEEFPCTVSALFQIPSQI